MRKNILISIALMAMASTAISAPLTPEEALERVSGAKGMGKAAIGKISATPVYTLKSMADRTSVYVFNRTDKGFLILSADDKGAPILGYSDTGTFSVENMPDAMKWWLNEYGRRIDHAYSIGAPAYEEAAADDGRGAIEPMIKTLWDQVAPYNNLCPLSGSTRTYTGCVATTMAQVMKYWEYPEVGQGNIAYNAPTLGKRLSMDFSKRVFDWDLMKEKYVTDYTDEEADAMAYLMRACGFAVKMDYTAGASSAYAFEIANAMVHYFNYDPNAYYAVRSLYSSSQWEQLIYDNLLNVGPVLYGGGSMMGGGHSFVCDGYDGAGYFHFNWGWSGISNGYFRLDALSPVNLGSGGGTGGGYNFTQDAVLGIQPPTGEPVIDRPMEIAQAGSLGATLEGSVLTFTLEGTASGSWLNYSPSKATTTFGAIIEDIDDPTKDAIITPIDHDPLLIKGGYGTGEAFVPYIDLAKIDLADGKYRFTFGADIAEDETHGMLPVRPFNGCSNSFVLVKTGDTYSLDVQAPARLKIVNAKLVHELYYSCLARVSATVANDTDTELSCGLAPAFYYDREGESEAMLYFIGKSALITVPPHSTVEHVWDTDLTAIQPIWGMSHDADMNMTFFDENTYETYFDDCFMPVVMKMNPGLSTMTVTDMKVPDAKYATRVISGRRMKVFIITDPYEIPFEFTATLIDETPFYYRMLAAMLNTTTEENGQTAITTYNGEAVFMNPGDEPYTMHTVLSYPYMKPNVPYLVTSAFVYGEGNFMPLAEEFCAIVYDDGSVGGVEDIIAEDNAEAPIYNLQGVCVGSSFDTLPAGIYICNGKKLIKK